MTSFAIKRVYTKPADTDGFRVLVDKLWPRGFTKEKAHIDEWAKEVAPSDALRKWFHHEDGKWEEFRKRYLHELKENPAIDAFLARHAARKKLTLVYGAKDEIHNQAAVLAKFLEEKSGK